MFGQPTLSKMFSASFFKIKVLFIVTDEHLPFLFLPHQEIPPFFFFTHLCCLYVSGCNTRPPNVTTFIKKKKKEKL